jgi:hypothetical protein
MNLNIEKDVPIPTMKRSGDWDYVSAIDTMEAGDSFVVPLDKRAAAISAFNRKKLKSITRNVGGGYCRIWRVQ